MTTTFKNVILTDIDDVDDIPHGIKEFRDDSPMLSSLMGFKCGNAYTSLKIQDIMVLKPLLPADLMPCPLMLHQPECLELIVVSSICVFSMATEIRYILE